MNQFIVKIITTDTQATGFLYFPPTEPDLAIAITAKHIFLDEDGRFSTEGAKIQFADENVYTVTDDDVVIVGGDNDKEDFVAFLFPRKKVTISFDPADMPILAGLTGKEKEAIVTGFPKAVENQVQLSLYRATILTQKDFPSQIQLEIADPLAELYNAGQLIEGYSGSPIIINDEKRPYFCGIFLAYHESTKRGVGVDLTTIIRTILERQGLSIALQEVETDRQVLQDIAQIHTNSTRVLGRISDTIGKNISLPRSTEQERLKKQILSKVITVVVGDAGAGKSSLTKQVLHAIRDDVEIIALQGEQLDKPSISEVFSEGAIYLKGTIEGVLDSPGLKKEQIIFLDSMEKLLETSNADTIIDFFNLVKNRRGLRIVLTCRSYAFEQLRIRFLQKFSFSKPYTVPPLTDKELDMVEKKLPFIKPLLAKPTLRKILRIPFNLDKSVSIKPEVLESGVNTEGEFRNIVWEYIVENRDNEGNAEIRNERGTLFQKIALDRAQQMVPYISLREPLNASILESLVRDNLVEENRAINSQYAVAHDIYEDWALTRFIDSAFTDTYLKGQTSETFLNALGYAPAVRRVFRIWISEKLLNTDYTLERLFQDILTGKEIQQYWKDEVIIAIMQSEYSETFLAVNKDLLFDNDYDLYRRCLLLLNVACQAPRINPSEEGSAGDIAELYANGAMSPTGSGWAAMIDFSHRHIDELDDQFNHILPFLQTWAKKLDYMSPVPLEGKKVGLLILRYLAVFREKVEDDEIDDEKFTPEIIPLLFKLTSVVRDEVKELVESVCFRQGKDPSYKIRQLEDKITEVLLSALEGYEVIRQLPELVIKVAENEWYHFPSNEEVGPMIRGVRLPRSIDVSEKFGVLDEYKRDYFPASAYQTPTYWLLQSNPRKAIRFIIKLFNHSAERLWDSDFLLESPFDGLSDQRMEIQYELSDGTTVKQFGSLAIWSIYRGTFVATPYLLQSVLMALEAWLLNLSKTIEKDTENERPYLRKILDESIDILLRESKSVATSAVLIGVSLAHKQLFTQKIIPLLKVKEFYNWDHHRKINESKALAPLGSSSYARLFQEERFTSNKLEHRSKHLEVLVLELSFGEYGAQILEMIDGFLREKPTDEQWQFSLNRMDRRKLKVLEHTPGRFVVQSEIDEELKPASEKAKAYIEKITPLQEATNWGIRKLKREAHDEDPFSVWQKYFVTVSSTISEDKRLLHFNQPTLIAAAGLRDYFDFLDEHEKKWCVERAFQVVDHEIKQSANPYNMDMTYGAFEADAAFIGLGELVKKADGDDSWKAKELLFGALVFIDQRENRKEVVRLVRGDLGKVTPQFAQACIAGLIAYSKISDLRIKIIRLRQFLVTPKVNRKIRRKISLRNRVKHLIKKIFSKRPPGKKELAKMELTYERKFHEIMYAVLNENIRYTGEAIGEGDVESYFSFEVFMLIPAETDNQSYRQFISVLLDHVKKYIDSENRAGNSKIHYETLQKFERRYALFLLEQPSEIVMVHFKKILDWVFHRNSKCPREGVELVHRILEEILTKTIEYRSYVLNFWQLWEILSTYILKSTWHYFDDIVLLDYNYWSDNDKEGWDGIKGRRLFFEPLVNHIGALKSTAKLVAFVGYQELMPNGILWLEGLLKDNANLDKNEKAYLEIIVKRVFYDKELRTIVRANSELKSAFLLILDALINQSSSLAFLIREDFISMNR